LRLAAREIGWRALVSSDDRVRAAVEVANKSHSSPSLTEDEYDGRTAVALEQAKKFLLHDAGYYEPNFLSVPALHIWALWLRNLDVGPDWIALMPPCPLSVEGGATIEAKAFIAACRHRAEETFRLLQKVGPHA
jgi:hypothetical protein